MHADSSTASPRNPSQTFRSTNMTGKFEKRPVDSYRPQYGSGAGRNRSPSPDWRQHAPRSLAPARVNKGGSPENRAPSGPVSGKLRSTTILLSSAPFKVSTNTTEGHRRRDSSVGPSRGQTPASPFPPRKSARHAENVEDITPGVILQLPRGFRTGESSPSALLQRQLWVNSRAANHPVLVWDVFPNERTGEKIARCLQMTSFGGKSVEEKYNYHAGRRSWRMHLQYIAIQQGGVPTPSVADMPSVALEGNQSMEKRTYIHLDHYFDIEARFLSTSSSQAPLRLTSDSLCVVTHKFDQFVRGYIWRRMPTGNWNDVVSPLDRLGVPKLVIGHAANERAEAGFAIESERRCIEDFGPWSGKELFGPDAFYPLDAPERSQWNWRHRHGTTTDSQQTNNDITH